MPDLDSKKVTVMGLGRFGGGAGVTRWLASQGAQILLTDLEPAEKLADSLHDIRDLVDAGQVTLRLGEHNVSDFTTCDLVIANPAVPKPWDNRFLRAAQAAGIPITTEIRLLVDQLPNRDRTIAITGSAGKSTTSAIIYHILSITGHFSFLGGNIGGSLLNLLDAITRDTFVVLEVSNAMLYWPCQGSGQDPLPRAPRVAVVTNLTNNPPDWPGSFEPYLASKKRPVEHQKPGGTAILGAALAGWPLPPGVAR